MAERTLVVGVDFSACSRKALDVAIALAKDMQARIVLVHGYAPVVGVGAGAAAGDPVAMVKAEIEKDEAVTLSTEWAGRARAAGVEAETVAKGEKPARLILEEAQRRGASMVVVGTHGRRGLKQLVLGSVAEAVVRASPVPVVVVPAT